LKVLVPARVKAWGNPLVVVQQPLHLLKLVLPQKQE
jgi:hypothetical protein